MIDISFQDRKLGEKLASDRTGAKAFGNEVWKALRRRLASLRAAPTLADMRGVPGGCHALRADRKGQLAVNVTGALRLVFAPDHDPVPSNEDGGLNWSAVTRIRVIEVVNYHGK